MLSLKPCKANKLTILSSSKTSSRFVGPLFLCPSICIWKMFSVSLGHMSRTNKIERLRLCMSISDRIDICWDFFFVGMCAIKSNRRFSSLKSVPLKFRATFRQHYEFCLQSLHCHNFVTDFTFVAKGLCFVTNI